MQFSTHPASGTIPVAHGVQPSSRSVLIPTTHARHATSTASAVALWRRVRVEGEGGAGEDVGGERGRDAAVDAARIVEQSEVDFGEPRQMPICARAPVDPVVWVKPARGSLGRV